MSEKIAIENARILDPERSEPRDATLLLEGGRIVDCVNPADAGAGWRRVDLGGRNVAPGFIDVHFHGELVTAPAAEFGDVLERAAGGMLQSGATAFLATTMAWSREQLEPAVAELAAIVERGAAAGADCLGLHLEGPWISGAAAGAMSRECIRPFEASEAAVLDAAGESLRMVTLAPEAPGAHALLAELERRGVVASLGHTRANGAQIDDGVRRGLRHVTHLFNAMGPMHHREPGVPGAVLADDRLSCDLICDGFHVHESMVRTAVRALGDRLLLITDRVDLPGQSDPGRFDGDGEPVRLSDGTIAGSQLSLDRAVRNARRFAGLTLLEAVAAGTLRPARLLGLENERGSLRRGARADLAVLDAEGRAVETWMEGRRVWAA